MDKLTCKHCGTKYDAAVGKCPVCGASNLPSVSEGFEFLDDDFEAKAPHSDPVEVTETAKDTAKDAAKNVAKDAAKDAAAEPPKSSEAPAATPPVSSDTGRYNWEDIIAEIHGKDSDKTEKAPKAQPTASAAGPTDEPAVSVRIAPPTPVQEDEETPTRERRKKSSAGKVVLITVLVLVLLAGAVYGLKRLGVFDKKTAESETPTLPVEQTEAVCTGITLSDSTLTLTQAGASQVLTATLQPADCTDTVNWVSANPDIATVDATGTVTAVAEGEANILAACGDYAETCVVTCDFTGADETGKVGEVTGDETTSGAIALSATDITMTYPGELAKLYVNNSGDKEVTWSTDNDTLVFVDSNGLITAKATGTCHVYAEVDGEKLECIVRCSLGGEEGKPITVSLNKTDISMFNAGESFQLVVSYEEGTPAGVTQEWSSSDEKVCTVDKDGVVTAVGAGTAFVSTVADGINLKCIVRITVNKTT
ncbi:MAG: Ig-like domain-containing protein [Oscillospiraceae bacterium]|nr:Ig-like domain-containing protein [Oscillospiraceae bacterium]